MRTAKYRSLSISRLILSVNILLAIALLPVARAATCNGDASNKDYSACAVTCVLGPLIGTYSGCAQGDFACICNQSGWVGAVTDCTPCACPGLSADMSYLTSSICSAVQDPGSGGSPATVTTTTTFTTTSYSYYTASAISYITTTFTADPTTVTSTATATNSNNGGGGGYTSTITSCPGSTSTGTGNSDFLDANATCTGYVSKDVAAGIGAGSAVVGIALAALIVGLLCRRRQRHPKQPKQYPSYVALTPSSGTLPPRAQPYKYPRAEVKQMPVVGGYSQVPQYRPDNMAGVRAVSPNSSSTAWSPPPTQAWMHEADANANGNMNRNGYGRGQIGGGRNLY